MTFVSVPVTSISLGGKSQCIWPVLSSSVVSAVLFMTPSNPDIGMHNKSTESNYVTLTTVVKSATTMLNVNWILTNPRNQLRTILTQTREIYDLALLVFY